MIYFCYLHVTYKRHENEVPKDNRFVRLLLCMLLWAFFQELKQLVDPHMWEEPNQLLNFSTSRVEANAVRQFLYDWLNKKVSVQNIIGKVSNETGLIQTTVAFCIKSTGDFRFEVGGI